MLVCAIGQSEMVKVYLTNLLLSFNVSPAENRTKHISILLLRLVRFSAGQTLS